MKSFQQARVCVLAVITAATLFACDGATTNEATAEDHAEPVDAVSNRVAIRHGSVEPWHQLCDGRAPDASSRLYAFLDGLSTCRPHAVIIARCSPVASNCSSNSSNESMPGIFCIRLTHLRGGNIKRR